MRDPSPTTWFAARRRLSNSAAYVGNDPVNHFDPAGEDTISVQFRDQIIRADNGYALPQWLSGGHSGIIIANAGGVTRYREYGRYPRGGPVRGRARGPVLPGSIVPNLVFDNGVPTTDSLSSLLGALIKIGAEAGSDDLLLTVRPDADSYDAAMSEVDRWDEEVAYNAYTGDTCHGFCEAVNDSAGGGRSREFELTPKNINETTDAIRQYYQEEEKPWWRFW